MVAEDSEVREATNLDELVAIDADAFAVTASETLLATAAEEWWVVEEVNADWLTAIAELVL